MSKNYLKLITLLSKSDPVNIYKHTMYDKVKTTKEVSQSITEGSSNSQNSKSLTANFQIIRIVQREGHRCWFNAM